MDGLERLQIERECERLVTRYCHLVDHGTASRVADLFAQDGVWRAGPVLMEGMHQLRKGFAAREANAARMSRHVCSNLLLDVIDADSARGTVYLTLYRHDGELGRTESPLIGPQMVGEYRDRFVRTDEGWRFAERELEFSFTQESEVSG